MVHGIMDPIELKFNSFLLRYCFPLKRNKQKKKSVMEAQNGPRCEHSLIVKFIKQQWHRSYACTTLVYIAVYVDKHIQCLPNKAYMLRVVYLLITFCANITYANLCHCSPTDTFNRLWQIMKKQYTLSPKRISVTLYPA